MSEKRKNRRKISLPSASDSSTNIFPPKSNQFSHPSDPRKFILLPLIDTHLPLFLASGHERKSRRKAGEFFIILSCVTFGQRHRSIHADSSLLVHSTIRQKVAAQKRCGGGHVRSNATLAFVRPAVETRTRKQRFCAIFGGKHTKKCSSRAAL